MDFDAGSFLTSLVVSGVGFVLFSYGRKMSRPPQILGGLILLVFPYFVSGAFLIAGIGAVVSGLVYLALRLGY